MGTARNPKRAKAIRLRIQGKSYGEIQKILNIKSKGTLSYWFKDIKLSTTAKRKLQRNIDTARKRGLFKFNKKRTQRVEKENDVEYKSGMGTIHKLSEYELLLIGAALYWGEGTKVQGSGSYQVELSNSDPDLIAIFMRFLREILKVPDKMIRGRIQIHPNVSENNAKKDEAGEQRSNRLVNPPKPNGGIL